MTEQTDHKHILFITSSRIGDAVLSSGLLGHIERTLPEARVTIACGPLVTSLFEGCRIVDKIYPLKKQKYNKHWVGLWKKTVARRWDMVIDLRNSAVSRAIPARRRFIFGPAIDQTLHKVEQAAQLMRLDYVPSPQLWPSENQREKALSLIPGHSPPVLGVGPTANWIGKTWPVERFIEIVHWMTEAGGVMAGARIAVFAAPGEEQNARILYESLREDLRLDLIAKTDPGTAAAALARCAFYIGNDSGLMHCAAAAGVPTLGLFGPSYPHLYRPWGTHCAYVSTPQSFDQLTGFEGYSAKTTGTLMGGLGVAAVQAQILQMFEQ